MHRSVDIPQHQGLSLEPGRLPIRQGLGNCLQSCAWLVIPLMVTSLALGVFLFLPMS